MEVINTLLNDVQVIKSPLFEDERGAFVKLFNASALKAPYNIQQINFVQNKDQYTLRGLHGQLGDAAESKFFRVLKGRIQLAFIDLRKNSEHYLNAGEMVLDDPCLGLLIPKGFVTGYLTLAPDTDVLYYSNENYQPEKEIGILWNDPLFNIPWQCKTPHLSAKDINWIKYQKHDDLRHFNSHL